MSTNAINKRSNYQILTGDLPKDATTKQIVAHNQKTIFDFTDKIGQNLATIGDIQSRTVSTYGMDGKNFFGRIIQRIKNLFHLSEYLENDTGKALSNITQSATKLRTSLNFQFKPESIKRLSTGSFDETIKMLGQLEQKIQNTQSSIDTPALETLTTIIKDIANQLKNLALYAVESKVLQSLKNGNIREAQTEIEGINAFYPDDPKTDEASESSQNFEETHAKWKQMENFQHVLDLLNELNYEASGQVCEWARRTWGEAKKVLRGDSRESEFSKLPEQSELSKLLEQHLDECYTRRIKTLSPDIQALEKGVKNRTTVTQHNLDMARILCQYDSSKYTIEELSDYVEDLARRVTIKEK